MTRSGHPARYRSRARLVAGLVLVGSVTTGGSAAAVGGTAGAGLRDAVASVGIVSTPTGTGTAFAVAENRLVTAAHVVDGAATVTVRVDGHDLTANVDAIAPALDLASLTVSGVALAPLTLRGAAEPEVGEPVYVAGAALGTPSLTSGVVSGERVLDGVRHLQTDAAINPGNSGGPLLSPEGDVLGVVVSKLNGAEGIGLAVPASDLRRWLAGQPVEPVPPASAPDPAPTGRAQGDTGGPAALTVLLLPVAGIAWLVRTRHRPLTVRLHPTAPTTEGTSWPR